MISVSVVKLQAILKPVAFVIENNNAISVHEEPGVVCLTERQSQQFPERRKLRLLVSLQWPTLGNLKPDFESCLF